MHEGRYITQRLKERGYDLAEVAELTGITENELRKVLEMETVPIDVVEKIAYHIGATTVKDFFSAKSPDFVPIPQL